MALPEPNHDMTDVSSPTLLFCLLGASLNAENRGVAALAMGAISGVSKGIKDSSVFLMDYGKDSETYEIEGLTTPVQLVNIRFSKQFLLRNNISRLLVEAIVIRLLPFDSARKRILERNHALRWIYEADIVGSIAGGDSFSDIYGLVRLLYVSLPQLLAIALGKRFILLPQTYGPFKGMWARIVARAIINKASLVCARDKTSLEDARKISSKPAARFRQCADVAFLMEPAEPSGGVGDVFDFEEQKPVVGFNVSGLLYIGGYTGKNMFSLSMPYPDLVERAIIKLIQAGANVVIIPHVFGTGGESDVPACRAVFDVISRNYSKNVRYFNRSATAQGIKFVIGKCDFFVGARMHACIAALSQGIPAVGLAYSKKFAGVFETVGVKDLVIDLRGTSGDSAIERIALLFKLRTDYKANLSAALPDAKQSVISAFAEMSNGSRTKGIHDSSFSDAFR